MLEEIKKIIIHGDIMKYYHILRKYKIQHGVYRMKINHIEDQKDNDKVVNLFIKECENKGFKYNEDYNGKDQDGVANMQFNTYKGRRMTSFRSYIAPLFTRFTGKCAYNIDVLPNSQVTRILSKKSNENENNLRAEGIELVYNRDINNKQIIKSAKDGEIILSAGAIGSPHILMLSGIGPKDELKEKNVECIADVPGVGKNLQGMSLY